MAAAKALSALIGLFAIRLAVTLPACNVGQFQVSSIVFKCAGSGGSVQTNQIKVRVPANLEKVVTTIPADVPNFQAKLQSSSDADLYLKSSITGQNIYKHLPGGEIPVGSDTRSGAYQGLHFSATQSMGIPTMESVECTGPTPHNLELVIRNNGDTEAVVDLGFAYGHWTAEGSCTYEALPHGCVQYNQARVATSAVDFSLWLSGQYATCEQAWTEIAAPHTGTESSVAGVPYYNWGKVYNQWPGAPAQVGQHLEQAMFKFATGGGWEDNKKVVRRTNFLWLCGLNQMKTVFLNACCSKLRSAFKDEEDAWPKLGKFAMSNGHQDPEQGLWEVCRSEQGVPPGGRSELFQFIKSDSRDVSIPADIKFCWPNGPVQVQPTKEPLVQTFTQSVDNSYTDPDQVAPWERDGTGHTPAPGTSPPETQTASTQKPVVPPGQQTATVVKGGTPYPVITEYPSTTARPGGHNIEDHTSEVPTGITMEPPFGGVAPTSTGPQWQGIATAVGVGAAVAAGVVGTAGGVYAHMTAQAQGTTLYPGQASISARRETVGSPGATDPQNGSSVFPVLLLLGVFCGFLLCAGIVGILFYCLRRRKYSNYYDRDMYPNCEGDQYDYDVEDEEELLANGGLMPMYTPHPLDVEAMRMMQ